MEMKPGSLFMVNNILCMWHCFAGIVLLGFGLVITAADEKIVRCNNKACSFNKNVKNFRVSHLYIMARRDALYYGNPAVGIWSGAVCLLFGALVLTGTTRKYINMGYFVNAVTYLIMIPAFILSIFELTYWWYHVENMSIISVAFSIKYIVEASFTGVQLILLLLQLYMNSGHIRIRPLNVEMPVNQPGPLHQPGKFNPANPNYTGGQVTSDTPQKNQDKNANPQQFRSGQTNPQQYPNSQTNPQQYPNGQTNPQQYPYSQTNPQQYPNSQTNPQQYPNSQTNPQQYPNSQTNPSQYPNSQTNPQQYPKSQTNPQQYPN